MSIQRKLIDHHFAAAAGPDQQANPILPRKIQVMLANAGAGNHQVTGADGSEHAFPGNGKIGIRREVIIPGNNDQFSNRSGARQAAQPVLPLAVPRNQDGQRPQNHKQEQQQKKISRSQGKNFKKIPGYAEHDFIFLSCRRLKVGGRDPGFPAGGGIIIPDDPGDDPALSFLHKISVTGIQHPEG